MVITTAGNMTPWWLPTRKHTVLSMGCLRRQAWEYTPYEYALVHDEGVADHGIGTPLGVVVPDNMYVSHNVRRCPRTVAARVHRTLCGSRDYCSGPQPIISSTLTQMDEVTEDHRDVMTSVEDVSNS